MKRVSHRVKTPRAIAAEWDAIAATRERQIADGFDHSATEVLAPAILKLLPRVDRLVDVGCGTGWLTVLAARKAGRVVGVDASLRSIELAMRSHSRKNVAYIHAEFGQFVRANHGAFGAAFANMTLSTVAGLLRLLRAVHSALAPGGVFVFTVPHPCFWPTYWGYSNASWFEYGMEAAIEASFKIGAEKTSYVTTHFHRPLQTYIEALRQTSFTLDSLRELHGRDFEYPRFLVARCVRERIARLTSR